MVEESNSADLFTDTKGHSIDPFYKCEPNEDAHKAEETAQFIREMGADLKKPKRIKIDKSIIVYLLIIGIILYLFFFVDLSAIAPTRTVEVRRTITEVPKIDEGIEVQGGRTSFGYMPPPEDWWNLSQNTSCKGIDTYKTERGFMPDWTDMITAYNKIYSHNKDEPMGMKLPEDIEKDPLDFDCEDIAHATRCLSEFYQVQCSFWTKEFTGSIVPTEPNHLGVCCKVEGNWKCI